jgi:hypothetical protein
MVASQMAQSARMLPDVALIGMKSIMLSAGLRGARQRKQ